MWKRTDQDSRGTTRNTSYVGKRLETEFPSNTRFLACVIALAAAQYHDAEGGGPPQRGVPIPIRSARFQRLPSTRPIAPTQSVYPNQRIRRPVSFRPRGSGAEEPAGAAAVPYPSAKSRPIPTASAPAHLPEVKPVNEEPEEDERNRDTFRDDRDDDRSRSQETSETEEESEENVARAVANLGAVGSTGFSRTPSGVSAQGQPAPVQYRPSYQAVAPTNRGGTGPGSSTAGQYRTQPAKPNKPRKQVVEESFKQQQVKPPPKPVKTPQVYDSRGKKPVAQIIRRYRDDNPDGSITWGFENDDGSYKEELIGVDCITRGKYGYIDPDGIRREYTYETGIKCDEEQREEDEDNGGFVDYQENKLVLPSGKTIDLSTMGKKQARRPRPIYGQ